MSWFSRLFSRKQKPVPRPQEVVCPGCGNRFQEPDVTYTTEDILARYGPNPVQCPKCSKIWSRRA